MGLDEGAWCGGFRLETKRMVDSEKKSYVVRWNRLFYIPSRSTAPCLEAGFLAEVGSRHNVTASLLQGDSIAW